jgi:hypothetical protein
MQNDNKEDSSDEDDENSEFFRLRCDECKRVHENAAMKKFFSLLAQQSDSNSPVKMNHLYTNYLSAVAGLSSLDEIRYHMTEMILHTLITNRSKHSFLINSYNTSMLFLDAINLQNASIPLNLSIELLNVKEELFGQKSVEFIEAGLFFMDVISILIDKSIIKEYNQLIGESMRKLMQAVKQICSHGTQLLIKNYVERFCYTCD